MNHMFPDELTSGVFELSVEWPAEVIQPREKTWMDGMGDGNPQGGGHPATGENMGSCLR